MERSLDERAFALAVYMLEHDATVRAAAAKFGVPKSAVHMAATMKSGLYGVLNELNPQDIVERKRAEAAAPALFASVRSIRSGGAQSGVGHSCACAAAASYHETAFQGRTAPEILQNQYDFKIKLSLPFCCISIIINTI